MSPGLSGEWGRRALAGLLAVAVTASLFALMQALVRIGGPARLEKPAPRIVDFVRLEQEERREDGGRRLPRKLEPSSPPPPPPLDRSPDPAADPGALATLAPLSLVPELAPTLELDGPALPGELGDREAVPIMRVAPQYPESAGRMGIAGWVRIGFTITADGRVRDPRVIQAEPPGTFDRAALRAVRRFQFRPRVVDGKAVDQPDQRITIRFDLPERSER